MSADGVCMFQQLLNAGKSGKRSATDDHHMRLLRQLLFPDSDCHVVRLIGASF